MAGQQDSRLTRELAAAVEAEAGGRLVRASVDWENGCEACWDAARAAGVVDTAEDSAVLAPPEWVGRPCPHGASPSAPSILRAAQEEV